MLSNNMTTLKNIKENLRQELYKKRKFLNEKSFNKTLMDINGIANKKSTVKIEKIQSKINSFSEELNSHRKLKNPEFARTGNKFIKGFENFDFSSTKKKTKTGVDVLYFEITFYHKIDGAKYQTKNGTTTLVFGNQKEHDKSFTIQSFDEIIEMHNNVYKLTSNLEMKFQGHPGFRKSFSKYVPNTLVENLDLKLNNFDWQRNDKLFKLLYQFDKTGFESFMSMFNGFIQSDCVHLLHFDKFHILKENNAAINYHTIPSYRDRIDKAISFKYINYEPNLDNRYKDYIKDIYPNINDIVPNSCWFNLICNTYYNIFEKKKNIQLNQEMIFKWVYPNKVFDKKGNNACCFDDMVEGFFKRFNLAIYLFDITYKIQAFYEPLKRNTHISPEVIYVLYHNEHVYHMNKNINSLNKLLDSHFEGETLLKPSNKFYLPKVKTDAIQYFRMETLKDLIKIIKNKDITGDIRILYEETTVFNLWKEMFLSKDFCYEAKVYKSETRFLSIHISNIGNKNITIFNHIDDDVSENLKFGKIEKYLKYEELKNEFVSNLLCNAYKSSYSKSTLQMIKDYYPKAVIGGFQTMENEKECYHIDINRDYTGILNNMKNLMSINSFDEFVDYQNETIQDEDLYFVKKRGNTVNYLTKRYNLCFGINIKDMLDDCEIISVLKMSKLIPNKASFLIAKIYGATDLTDKMKKDIANTTIGRCGKKLNKKHYCNFTKSEEECNSFIKQYKGIKTPYFFNEEDKIYENEMDYLINEKPSVWCHYIKMEEELTDGFLPINMFIVDRANKLLFDLKKKLVEFDIEIYGCNTDCFYVEYNHQKIESFKNAYPKYFNYQKKTDYNAIGKLKIDVKIYQSPSKCMTILENENKYVPFVYPESTEIKIENEFDSNEIDEVLLNNNFLMVRGVAGSGKSFAFKHLNKKTSVIMACPTNSLAFEHRNNGLESRTVNKILGQRFNGTEDCRGGVAFDITNYDCVVFDEMNMNNIDKLIQIKKFMEKHPEKKFYCVYAPEQLDAIDYNFAGGEQYYSNVIHRMFPNYIKLRKNKRCKSNLDRAKMDKMTSEILNANDVDECRNIIFNYCEKIYKSSDIYTQKNISFLNDTSCWLNQFLHKNKDGQKYYVGLKLRGASTVYHKDYVVFNNYEYLITEMNEKYIVVDDNEMIQEIPVTMIDKLFTFTHSMTCHCAEGVTIEEPFTIFDIYHPRISKKWIYTAITRCVEIKYINIYVGKYDYKIKKMDDIIKERISSHYKEDLKKNRNIDNFITEDWVKKELSRSRSICHICCSYICSKTFSINRLNNAFGHTQDNCEIICRNCNCSQK